FPEGTRSPDGTPQEPKGGVGFMVAKGNCPVVPIHVSGTYEALPKGASRILYGRKVWLVVGQPILPEEMPVSEGKKTDYNAIARFVMDRILALDPRESADISQKT
ncbi:MAG: lysophospholipid acyltransferase family protein, partial [Verrucomicrobiota bacterium]